MKGVLTRLAMKGAVPRARGLALGYSVARYAGSPSM